MSRMSDYAIGLEEAMALTYRAPDMPDYDGETDPDPRIDDLETQVERLTAELARWAQHLPHCPGRRMGVSAAICACGLTQAREGTLWEGTDSVEIADALAQLEDDARKEAR